MCSRESGFPTYTFVEPAQYKYLKVALRTTGRGIAIGKKRQTCGAPNDTELGDRAQLLSGRYPDDQEIDDQEIIAARPCRIKYPVKLIFRCQGHRTP
jgi:hypothetical protein